MGYIVAFGSTSHAIKAEQRLLENRIDVAVLPLPPRIRAGCGICLRVGSDSIGPALACLAEVGIDDYTLHGDVPSTPPGDVPTIPPAYVQYMPPVDAQPKPPSDVPLASGKHSLTEDCASGGCGSKIGPGELPGLLAGLPVYRDGNLLVGFESSDDAAVYRLDERRSLVTTADFFPPMIDDPVIFGRIAAANALSDVYAMGAKPLTALNLVCFPQSMDTGVLKGILLGGAEKVAEACAALCGGHSIYGKEIKYGLAVTGIADNDKIIRNNTPEPGGKLILTKPLGTGLIMAALRGGVAGGGAVGKAVRSMERLNRYAAEKVGGFHVSACTDITGFGLLAHLLEMASDRASIVLYPDEVPYFEEAYGYASEYLMTAAGQRNRNHLEGKADVGKLAFELQELLFDPQTSCGLLLCVDAGQAEGLLNAIREGDPAANIVGEVVSREDDAIIFG